MLIVTEARLNEYAKKHAAAASSLLMWGALIKAASWRRIADAKRTFPHADQVRRCVVFNVKGNDFRLITRIEYGLQTVTLKYFLTHADYDRAKWKKDCS